MATTSTRRYRSSGADDAWAVAGAMLTELSRGLAENQERDRIRQRQDEQDAETRRYHRELEQDREERQKLAAQTEALRKRDDASQQLDQMRGDIGGGIDLDPSAAAYAQDLAMRAGRPGVLRPGARAPMAPGGAAAAAMGDPVMSAILSLPQPAAQFRRSAAEQKVYDDDQARTALNDALAKIAPTLPPNTRAAVDFARSTGRPVPTLQPNDFVQPKTPEQIAAEKAAERDAAYKDFERRARFTDSLRDENRVGGGSTGIRKDNPKMPRGVSAYIGQLTTKYGANRAAAADELQRAIPNLQRDHPDLDLSTLRQEFNAAFPKPDTGADDLGGFAPPAPVRPSPIVSAPSAAPPAAPPAAPGAAPVVNPNQPLRPAAAAAPPRPPQVTAAMADLQAALATGDRARIAAARERVRALTGR